jgi:hypothetical protein
MGPLSLATCESERNVAAHGLSAVAAFQAQLALALTGQFGLLRDVELDRLPKCVPGGRPDILVRAAQTLCRTEVGPAS